MSNSEITYQSSREKFGEYGAVEESRHPLVFVRGLPGISLGEVVLFDNEKRGQVLGFNEDLIEILVFAGTQIKPGVEVARTGEQVSVFVGDSLRGQVINPLGESYLEGQAVDIAKSTRREIDTLPPHISSRRGITKPFFTGTTAVDLMLPLARGQREAVIGDLTTGKNSFLLTAISAHVKSGGMVVYAAIGKPWNDIKRAYNFISENTNKENVIMVAASADDIISMIYLAPFTAMAIAEYWRDQGQDVLIVLDDLSTHAKFYREIGLLARRFPARESYPGDIFHLHARLLERGGNFFHKEKGEVSITCLPVAETVSGDLTGYIVSNLISITDGHLLFDEAVFSQGRRPAINIPLSVTRVGSHTQTPLIRALHRKLVVLLNRHKEAQRYTHFGAELHEDLQRVLDAGDALLEFLSQPLYVTVPYRVQVLMAAMIWMGWLNGKVNEVAPWRDQLTKSIENNQVMEKYLDSLLGITDLDEFAAKLDKDRDQILAFATSTVSVSSSAPSAPAKG